MREITTHKVDTVTSPAIYARDERGSGNANHSYAVEYATPGPSLDDYEIPITSGRVDVIDFQNGPVIDGKMNGITNEVLLAIVIDRLEGFQSGPFACFENGIALTHAKETMKALTQRTRDRVARNVEGKLEK